MFSFAGGRARNARGRKMGARGALGYLYKWRERERGVEAKGEARGDEREGDGEKGIRAGITLGDCGIVNPCRVALVLLLFLSPALSICLSLFHPLQCRPPFPLPSSPLPFPRLTPSLSLFLFSSRLAFSSSTYPSHGLVRRWNIGEQRIDGCWEG